MLTHDKNGHRLRNVRVTNKRPIHIQDQDIWGLFEPPEVHGPLFTSVKLRFDSFYRKNPKVALDRLGRFYTSEAIYHNHHLVGGPFFDRADPLDFRKPDERTTLNRFTVIHSLNDAGKRFLKKIGRHHEVIHTGWSKHQIANAHISASLHLGVLEDDLIFYPADHFTKDIGYVVPFEIEGTPYNNVRYVPDFAFGALDKKGRGRYFILETDLGNEVGKASEPRLRKTYERMVLQILSFIGDGIYRQAYGIDKGMLALIVSTSRSKLDLMKTIIAEKVGRCNYILLKYEPPESFDPYLSPKPLDLWTTPWQRVGKPHFYLNNPERQ